MNKYDKLAADYCIEILSKIKWDRHPESDITYGLKALNIAYDFGVSNPSVWAVIYNALGDLYRGTECYNVSIEYYNRVLEMENCSEIDRRAAMSGTFMTTFQRGDLENAIYLNEKFKSFKLYGDTCYEKGVCAIWREVANIFFREKDYYNAKLYYSKALNYTDDTSVLAKISKRLINICDRKLAETLDKKSTV